MKGNQKMASSSESRAFGQVAWLLVTFLFALLGTYGAPWMHFLVVVSGIMFVLGAGAGGWAAFVPRYMTDEGMLYSRFFTTFFLSLIFGFWFFHWLGAGVVIILSYVMAFVSI